MAGMKSGMSATNQNKGAVAKTYSPGKSSAGAGQRGHPNPAAKQATTKSGVKGM